MHPLPPNKPDKIHISRKILHPQPSNHPISPEPPLPTTAQKVAQKTPIQLRRHVNFNISVRPFPDFFAVFSVANLFHKGGLGFVDVVEAVSD